MTEEKPAGTPYGDEETETQKLKPVPEMPEAQPLQMKASTCGFAIASLILGILSMFLACTCIGIVPGIAGAVCGHIGRSRIRKSEGLLTGSGVCIAGLILSYVGLLANIVMIALSLLPPILAALGALKH